MTQTELDKCRALASDRTRFNRDEQMCMDVLHLCDEVDLLRRLLNTCRDDYRELLRDARNAVRGEMAELTGIVAEHLRKINQKLTSVAHEPEEPAVTKKPRAKKAVKA